MSFEEVFQEGVKSFQSKDFEKATNSFSQALDLQPENTTVLVNLALAEFQAGQKAAAYAHFKKALQIDPYFSTAQQGLEFVKSQFQIHEIPHRLESYEQARRLFVEPFSFALPLVLSTLIFLTWGYRTLKYLGNRKRSFFAGEDPSSYGVANLLLSIIFVLSLSWVALFKYDSSFRRGIVKVEAVPVRSAPLETSPEILQVYGGLEVRILREQEGWLQIEYPGSVAGWIPAKTLVAL